MDWDRWWEKEGMAHALVRVDDRLRTLRIDIHRDTTPGFSEYIQGNLELLTSNGWVILHQTFTPEEKMYGLRSQELLVRLARYAEAIYPGMYDTQANQNSYKTYLSWKEPQ